MQRGKVNPKVQTLMGRDSSFASEQRPTGVQSFISKVLFLFFFLLLLLSYLTERFLGHGLKGKAHTQSKQKRSKGSPGGGGSWNKARPC